MGNSIVMIIIVLFDASLVMYINRTSIPPTMIMNRIYMRIRMFCMLSL